MTREIKFRGRLGDKENWFYFTLGDLVCGSTTHTTFKNAVWQDWCEFTGLHDKNGKEIYEGDVIQAVYPSVLEPLMRKRGERYEIVFRLGAFKAFDLATVEGDIEDSFLHAKSFGRAHLEGHEVIGNIYENPELLDANQKGDD